MQLLYHGSPSRKTLDAFGSPGNVAVRIEPGRPFFVTPSLEYATMFARGGLVTAFALKASHILDLHDESQIQRLLRVYNADPIILASEGPWDEMMEGDIQDSPYRLLDSPAVTTLLQREGVDAVYLAEDNALRVKSLAILSGGCLELQHVFGSEHKPRMAPGDDLCP